MTTFRKYYLAYLTDWMGILLDSNNVVHCFEQYGQAYVGHMTSVSLEDRTFSLSFTCTNTVHVTVF